MTKDLEKLKAKELKIKSLIDKSFLFRDLFLGFVLYCFSSKLLGLVSSSLSDILIISIIVTLATTTLLRRRIYRDRLKSIQLKIEKLSQV